MSASLSLITLNVIYNMYYNNIFYFRSDEEVTISVGGDTKLFICWENSSLVNKLALVFLENMILVWTEVSDFKHIFFNSNKTHLEKKKKI